MPRDMTHAHLKVEFVTATGCSYSCGEPDSRMLNPGGQQRCTLCSCTPRERSKSLHAFQQWDAVETHGERAHVKR